MEIKKSPIWKQALLDFRMTDLNFGDIITREWLLAHFELEEPKTADEYKTFSFQLINNFIAFRDVLLEQHSMDLRVIHGTGNYLIVHPKEQTAMAVGDFKHAFTRLMGRTFKRITHVELGQLSDSERQENTDAIAKLSGLRSLTTEKKWLS